MKFYAEEVKPFHYNITGMIFFEIANGSFLNLIPTFVNGKCLNKSLFSGHYFSSMEQDKKLWEKIRNGDTSAMRVLHDRYYYQLYLYAQKIYNHPAVLDEAVSDCFIKLWIRRKDLIIERSVKFYLFLMLRNGLIDILRKKDKLVHFEEGAFPETPDGEIQNEMDRYALLNHALGKIPEQRRRILEMAVFESCTYAQIAEKLEISVNTVKTQIGRAYRFLKEALDPKSMQLLFILKAQSSNSK